MRFNVNLHPVTLAAGVPFVMAVDKDRSYLSVICTADTTVTFSNGVAFIVKAGQVLAPIPAPINAITLSGAGTILVGVIWIL